MRRCESLMTSASSPSRSPINSAVRFAVASAASRSMVIFGRDRPLAVAEQCCDFQLGAAEVACEAAEAVAQDVRRDFRRQIGAFDYLPPVGTAGPSLQLPINPATGLSLAVPRQSPVFSTGPIAPACAYGIFQTQMGLGTEIPRAVRVAVSVSVSVSVRARVRVSNARGDSLARAYCAAD